MTPATPRVDVRSAGDKATREQARAKYEAAKERHKAARAANAARPNGPYDLVADALFNACGDAIIAALNSPDFAHELETRHGLAVVPALADEPPAAPWEWVEALLDHIDPDSTPANPIEHADELWAQAWRAGYEAASTHGEGR